MVFEKLLVLVTYKFYAQLPILVLGGEISI